MQFKVRQDGADGAVFIIKAQRLEDVARIVLKRQCKQQGLPVPKYRFTPFNGYFCIVTDPESIKVQHHIYDLIN